MKLDIMTLLVMNLIVNTVGVWAMAIIWRENWRRYSGIGFWVVNMACQAAGLGLVLAKGLLPDLFCIVLANFMLQAGAAFLLVGLQRFVGVTAGQCHNAALLVVFIFTMSYFTYFQPDVEARQITVSFAIILIMGQACLLLFRSAPPQFKSITNIAAYVLSGFVAVSALRIVMILASSEHIKDFFASGLADALAITLYTTLNACLSICLVMVVNKRLLEEVQHLKDELEVIATHDTLTGVPNRALFCDRFSVALANAKRAGAMLAVMSLDLDGFKKVNDSLGHAAGDKLLVESAKRIKAVLRKVDTVARFGGDEFVLLLWDLESGEDAKSIAGKVLEALRNPFVLDGREAAISASIGIALYPEDGEEAEGLIKKSDEALYFVKGSGKNGYRLYQSA